MTRCACSPVSAYSSPPCCREGGPESRCPAPRCQHPESSSRELLAELEDTHRMLRATKERRDRLRSELAETQNTVERLVVETERLETALLASVRGTERRGEWEGDAPEGLTAALRGVVWQPPGSAVVDTVVDLG